MLDLSLCVCACGLPTALALVCMQTVYAVALHLVSPRQVLCVGLFCLQASASPPNRQQQQTGRLKSRQADTDKLLNLNVGDYGDYLEGDLLVVAAKHLDQAAWLVYYHSIGSLLTSP